MIVNAFFSFDLSFLFMVYDILLQVHFGRDMYKSVSESCSAAQICMFNFSNKILKVTVERF